ncbi:MAG: hypothetical protein HY812_09355 [Planctomycetes bacterium]|nr:hypothetical protein [Planctomycetota bacterium]
MLDAQGELRLLPYYCGAVHVTRGAGKLGAAWTSDWWFLELDRSNACEILQGRARQRWATSPGRR